MNFNSIIFGHKDLLITQDKIGRSCMFVPGPRVCQRVLKMPNPAHLLVLLPGQVWSRAYARGWVGWDWTPHFGLIFYKNFISCAKEIIVFAYSLLIYLST